MRSKALIITALFVTIAISVTAEAQQTYTALNGEQAKAIREVYITSDSAPGWLPSEELGRQVAVATDNYFAALDSGQYQTAYEMMAPVYQQTIPFMMFAEQSRQFDDLAGPLVRRWLLRVTWTKDPPSGPLPGIYAAVDVASKFENVDRECGFLILYQESIGSEFQLMRAERNYIDNTTAETIERTKSRAVLDELWLSLSKNCPNFSSLPLD